MSGLSLFDLTGKKCLGNGGRHGSRARLAANALASAGANVAIVDLNEEVGLKTAESIRAQGVDACFVRCDVADRRQIQQMTAIVVQRFGPSRHRHQQRGSRYCRRSSETLAPEEVGPRAAC